MTDIVERLQQRTSEYRNAPGSRGYFEQDDALLMAVAADEIERLRRERDGAIDAAVTLKAENERLRGEG